MLSQVKESTRAWGPPTSTMIKITKKLAADRLYVSESHVTLNSVQALGTIVGTVDEFDQAKIARAIAVMGNAPVIRPRLP
jgi:hypothetical protein